MTDTIQLIDAIQTAIKEMGLEVTRLRNDIQDLRKEVNQLRPIVNELHILAKVTGNY